VAAIVVLASFLYLIVGQVLLVTVLSPQVLAGTGLTLQVSMIMMVVGVAIFFYCFHDAHDLLFKAFHVIWVKIFFGHCLLCHSSGIGWEHKII
jgi:hypothetical protein